MITDLLNDVDDITEPSCMEKILLYYEELQEKDNLFMELLVEKRNLMEITWEQPWYQQTKSLTRKLKDEVNSNEQYNSDPITKAEIDRIKKNWRKFRKKFDVPDRPECLARWKSKGRSRNPNTPEERVRRYVAAYLARGLKRTIHQVYRYFNTHYGSPVKGPYTPEEVKVMKICFHHSPLHAASVISTVLGRENRGIYKKLSELYDGKLPKKNKLKWTLPLASKFVRLLIQYSGLSLEELKNERFKKSVWLKLQEGMDQHYLHLQDFWYRKLHVQIFVKFDVKINKLQRKIYKIIRSSPCEVWSDIRWKEILRHFPDGFTHSFLYRTAIPVLLPNIKAQMKLPVQDIVNYALHKLKKRRKDRRLKTLIYRDGNLEVIKYESKSPAFDIKTEYE